MEKDITAMQLLIVKWKFIMNKATNAEIKALAKMVVDDANQLLNTEERQITQACQYGYENATPCSIIHTKQYFNDKYGK